MGLRKAHEAPAYRGSSESTALPCGKSVDIHVSEGVGSNPTPGTMAEWGPFRLYVLDHTVKKIRVKCSRCANRGVIEKPIREWAKKHKVECLCDWCYIKEQKEWAERVFAARVHQPATPEMLNAALKLL